MLQALRNRYFVSPPEAPYRNEGSTYVAGHSTYTSYNYLGRGPVSRIKRLHFEAALQLTRESFGQVPVIDFGCADGVFLPSLARHFPAVCAVDMRPAWTDIAEDLVAQIGATNVEVVCNNGTSMDDLASRLRAGGYELMFLLETLEHIGDPARLYESKIEFLEQLFEMLSRNARIVISVPTMVGVPFAIQRAALRLSALQREPISTRDFLRAVALRSVDGMEADWSAQRHLGFNHLKLQRYMYPRFELVARQNLFFSQLYVIRRR